jgi:hypothetical protein
MCGSKPQSAIYTYNMQERKVPMMNVNVLNKWAAGAIARRKFKRIIITKMIAELKYPKYEEKTITWTADKLLTDQELFIIMDFKRGSKTLVWNNFFKDIGKNK